MKHSISPYPQGTSVKGDKVFFLDTYCGYVDRVQNWGTDFLARSEHGENQYFKTKTDAVLYLITQTKKKLGLQ